jgi:hypothetical protein
MVGGGGKRVDSTVGGKGAGEGGGRESREWEERLGEGGHREGGEEE